MDETKNIKITEAVNETQIVNFSKITITNRFMFPLVMSHKEIAKPFIEAALGIKIYDLRDPEQEKTEQVSVFSKSVRYDVYTQEIDENGKTLRSFDLEMQVEDTKELPKRARYYQSIHDTRELQKNVLYKDLKDQYVLFICPNDIFKGGLPIYSFQNYATENKNIALDDRTFKNYCIFGYMTWEQEIQIAAAEAAEAAAEKERKRSEKIIAEKDAEIAALKLKLAEKSK